jgi:signal transduction histidine kinase
MNPLPRILSMALFTVLAATAAVLAVAVWRVSAAPSPGSTAGTAALAVPVIFSLRIALGLALIALVLTGTQLFSFGSRNPGSEESSPASGRGEMGALARLAENSVAQSAALDRERDVRRRAEADAELRQQLLAQSVDEKIRLGQDLHDGIIQSLYALGLTIETIRPLLKTDPAQAERRLDEVRENLNGAIRDVRGYIGGLAPDNLRRVSFSRAVQALFEQLRAGREAEIELRVEDDAAARLSFEQNLEALQIAREAISNALRHGGARHLVVRLHQGEREVGLLVQDDGRGFNVQNDTASGHGLGNMRARAGRVGGDLRVASHPGQGARITATFPVSSPATS